MSLGELTDAASKLTVIALLLIIVWGGTKEWWVYGREYRRVLRELEEWRDLALTATGIADKAADLAAARTRRSRTTANRSRDGGEESDG